MLHSIKQEMTKGKMAEQELEMMLEANTGSDDIRDMMLDSIEMDVVGAENDEEVEKLLDLLPDFDDTDQVATDVEISSLVESLTVPKTF